jgi:hypothetical protein
VDKDPREPEPVYVTDASITLELLLDTGDAYEAGMVEAMLTEENIPFVQRHSGPGGYLKYYMGGGIGTLNSGTQLYVSQKDYARARELLDAYFSGEPVEEEGQSPHTDDFTGRKLTFRVGLWIVLLINFIFIVFAIIYNRGGFA